MAPCIDRLFYVSLMMSFFEAFLCFTGVKIGFDFGEHEKDAEWIAAAVIREIDEISKEMFVKAHFEENIYKDVFVQLESLDNKLKIGKK